MRRFISLALSMVVIATLLVGATVGAAPQRADRGAWAPGVAYAVGDTVTYNGVVYKCLQAHTSQTGWEPPNVPALWQPIGTPTPGGGATATRTPTRTNTPSGATATRTPTRTNTPSGATATRTPTRTNTPSGATATRTPTRTNTPAGATNTPTRTNTPPAATNTPTRTPTSGAATCAVQSAPSGKVLVGYWESWDGSGVHPGMGHISLSEVHPNYNVIVLAFPVILSDGTVLWEDGMDVGVDVPTPAEICAEKAKGRRILLSVGGAAAGIDLSSTAVADRFVQTIVPILKANNFDGIDIDIETGLVAGSSFSQLSASQSNLIRIIDGILAQMPSNFMLTMAPETAYVTGGQIAYGGPWGAYLPVIKKYLDNGRLSWLQMQYYNGSMYGCPGGVPTSYSAGTVEGFVEQTKCMANGFWVAGNQAFIQIPYSKQVPGLPAQPGAGGGYMSPSLVTQAYNQVSSIKGLMTWSINWDGSKGWTFALNIPW